MRTLSIIFALLCYGISLQAQNETASYIMNDGTVKKYNLNDIEDVSVKKGQTAYEMKIHLKTAAPVAYASDKFDSVNYNRDAYNNYVYTVYSGTNQFNYLLLDIDSVNFNTVVIPKDMVLIPAGTFQMGNTGAYSGYDDEKPVHTVTISQAFYMSKYEITQHKYRAVIWWKNNPSYFIGENLPVEQVTWDDAILFCNAMSLQEGRTLCYTINGTDVTCNFEANGYRLPTEAEWEYACKAGTTTDFYSGDLIYKGSELLDPNLDKIGWYSVNSSDITHEVGQKEPNAFGLYDMNGNVLEWCWDLYGDYLSTTVTDPTGPSSGSWRVLRGGSWYDDDAVRCRSAYRAYATNYSSRDRIGFRIVRVDK